MDPAINSPGFSRDGCASWSPSSDRSDALAAVRDRHGRHVSYMPGQDRTYTGAETGTEHIGASSDSHSLSSTSSHRSLQDEDLHHLSLLSFPQLASLMNDCHLLSSQAPQPTNNPPVSHQSISHEAVSKVVHHHGEVFLSHHTGIQASAANSGLAALFMCLSHNQLSDTFISETKKHLSCLPSDADVCSLGILASLLEAFGACYFNHHSRPLLPGDSLQRLRPIYQPDRPNAPLDPIKIIQLLLNDIYGRTGVHRDILLSDQSNLCRTVAFIDITSDKILLENFEEASDNFNPQIRAPEIPPGLRTDNDVADDIPDPRNPAVTVCRRAAYKDNKLQVQFTARVFQPTDRMCPPQTRIPIKYLEHLSYSFLVDAANNLYLYADAEPEWHPHKNRAFLRSCTVYQTDDFATPRVIEQKMRGYDAQSPDQGRIITRTYLRASCVDDMISKSWLEELKSHRGTQGAMQLLPGHDNAPQVLIVALPDYNIKQRIDINWHKNVHLPTNTGDKIPYELSALISKDKSLCYAWLLNQKEKLIYCADSQGKKMPHGNNIPTMVCAPFPDSKDELKIASENCSAEQQISYSATMERINSLGSTACLLIYRKKADA